MMTRSRFLLLAGIAAMPIAAWACTANPSIDGANVPKFGGLAPPSCEDVCHRLELLCGYPPVDCVALCSSDTDGYDDVHRVCVGQASSCREALQDCVNADPVAGDDAAAGDAGDGGSDDDASGQDAAPDGGSDADAG